MVHVWFSALFTHSHCPLCFPAAGRSTGPGARPSALCPDLRSRRRHPGLLPWAVGVLHHPHPGFQHHPGPSRSLPVITAPPEGRGLVIHPGRSRGVAPHPSRGSGRGVALRGCASSGDQRVVWNASRAVHFAFTPNSFELSPSRTERFARKRTATSTRWPPAAVLKGRSQSSRATPALVCIRFSHFCLWLASLPVLFYFLFHLHRSVNEFARPNRRAGFLRLCPAECHMNATFEAQWSKGFLWGFFFWLPSIWKGKFIEMRSICISKPAHGNKAGSENAKSKLLKQIAVMKVPFVILSVAFKLESYCCSLICTDDLWFKHFQIKYFWVLNSQNTLDKQCSCRYTYYISFTGHTN